MDDDGGEAEEETVETARVSLKVTVRTAQQPVVDLGGKETALLSSLVLTTRELRSLLTSSGSGRLAGFVRLGGTLRA